MTAGLGMCNLENFASFTQARQIPAALLKMLMLQLHVVALLKYPDL